MFIVFLVFLVTLCCHLVYRFFFLYHFLPYAYFVRFNGQFWFLPFLFHWLMTQVCVGGWAVVGVWAVGGGVGGGEGGVAVGGQPVRIVSGQVVTA